MSAQSKKSIRNRLRLSFWGAAQVDVDDLIMSDKVGRQLDAVSQLMKERRRLSASKRAPVTAEAQKEE